MTATLQRLPAPWRATHPFASAFAAVRDASDAGDAHLREWCRATDARAIPADVLALLTWSMPRVRRVAASLPMLADVETAYRRAAETNLARVGRLLAVLPHLEAAGVRPIVLKGAALVLRYYHAYGARPMGDVDVLVEPGAVASSVAVLRRLGWTAPADRKPGDLRARMRVHHALPLQSGRLHGLDLHWRLGSSVTTPVEQGMRAAAETVEINGTTVRILAPADQVFHVCLHAVQPSWVSSARWMMDVAAVLDARGAHVDWDRVVHHARASSTTQRLLAALGELRRLLGDRVPTNVVERLTSGPAAPWERRELSLFARMPPYAAEHVARWHWYQFRRLRGDDSAWRRLPVAIGFGDYVRLKLHVRRLDRRT